MIVLFTDFGVGSPYVGQMQAVLQCEAPGVPVINLFADAPAYDAKAAAYLLAAYGVDFPAGTVFLAVVDPGVGSERPGVVLEADGRWYVGPGNGLFELVARRATAPVRWWDITWSPEHLSATFHGRDLFAPTAARIACRGAPDSVPGLTPSGGLAPSGGLGHRQPDWPDDLAEVVYIDGFGNVVTGLRASALADDVVIEAGSLQLHKNRTFSDVPPGTAFWYENANGLVELAVNQDRADRVLGIQLGATVNIKTL